MGRGPRLAPHRPYPASAPPVTAVIGSRAARTGRPAIPPARTAPAACHAFDRMCGRMHQAPNPVAANRRPPLRNRAAKPTTQPRRPARVACILTPGRPGSRNAHAPRHAPAARLTARRATPPETAPAPVPTLGHPSACPGGPAISPARRICGRSVLQSPAPAHLSCPTHGPSRCPTTRPCVRTFRLGPRARHSPARRLRLHPSPRPRNPLRPGERPHPCSAPPIPRGFAPRRCQLEQGRGPAVPAHTGWSTGPARLPEHARRRRASWLVPVSCSQTERLFL